MTTIKVETMADVVRIMTEAGQEARQNSLDAHGLLWPVQDIYDWIRNAWYEDEDPRYEWLPAGWIPQPFVKAYHTRAAQPVQLEPEEQRICSVCGKDCTNGEWETSEDEYQEIVCGECADKRKAQQQPHLVIAAWRGQDKISQLQVTAQDWRSRSSVYDLLDLNPGLTIHDVVVRDGDVIDGEGGMKVRVRLEVVE